MRRMVVAALAAFAGLAGSAIPASTEQPVPAIPPVTGRIAPAPVIAPEMLVSAAVLAVTASFRQDENIQANSAEKIAEVIESMDLPLFDFRHMTRLAMALDWHRASPEQRNALIAEFRKLVVRAYATAVANNRERAIEYKLLRIAPGETGVTVRSTVKRPGAECVTIDYDMEKTTTGWKVYDITIAGISLITMYRSTFARSIRDDGVDGLIKTLSARNRYADSELRSNERGALPVLIMYGMMTSAVRGGR